MWIASVIIMFLVFLSMLSEGEEEVAVFVLGGLLLAVIIRLSKFSTQFNSKYQQLEKKYVKLEKELHLLKTSKDETLKESIQEPEKITDTAVEEVFAEQEDVLQKEYVTPLTKPVQNEKHVYSKPSSIESSFDKALHWVIAYFKKGNPLVKVGGVLLFFGLSFLIKFAAEKDMVSTEMGLFSTIVFAVILTGVGWKYKDREGSFGLILQGVGIAVFYLSIFSSAKYFEIIPFGLALGIMVFTVIFASYLALVQNSMSLALFATAGGFLSPILTSTGQGSHVVLFSYYALLNVGIISMAWYKSWRPLNLTGFAFTFIISLVWGARSYTPEFFWSTEPFLIFFFLLYVGVSVIFAYKSEYTHKAYVDSSLLFGVPATAFAMQGALVKDIEFALSFSALVIAAFYLSLAWVLRRQEKMSLLAESFLALGVVFVTLAVPFALDGHWTAVTWTLEATAIIWISLRQDRFYARIFAVVLQVLAGFVFFVETIFMHEVDFILNNVFLGSVIVSLAAFTTSFVLEKYQEALRVKEYFLQHIFMGLALIWWIFSGMKEIDQHLQYAYDYTLVYFSLSALLFAFVSKRVNFKGLKEVLVGFFPLAILTLLVSFDLINKTHPFAGVGYISVPLFLLVHYLLLYLFNFKNEKYWHVGGLWVGVLLLTWELYYQIHTISAVVAYASGPLLAVLALVLIVRKRNFWPLSTFSHTYQSLGLQGISLILVIMNLYLFGSSAVLKEIGYIPFFNPLDMMQVVSLLAVVYWMKSQKEGFFSYKKTLYVFTGVSSISLLSVFVARSVHFYADVYYNVNSLLHSDIFHAGISILYSLVALMLILSAKKRKNRNIWIVGASLLGFVTLKLFFVELSHTGSLSRIISFMGVGVLILVIGYFAPLPPKKEESL